MNCNICGKVLDLTVSGHVCDFGWMPLRMRISVPAEELEALRKELKIQDEAADILTRQNQELRKERDDLEKTIHKAIDIHTTAVLEIVKLTKERDAYREALADIAKAGCCDGCSFKVRDVLAKYKTK